MHKFYLEKGAADAAARGREAERRACAFLEKCGHTILETNYRSRCGEIDIISEVDNTLVFTEVKYRSSAEYGAPAEQVTRRKQQKICKTAARYLQQHRLTGRAVRFDVAALTPQGCEIIENAFLFAVD